MLRVFLTVSVLFGHQIAAKDIEQEVIDLCTHVDCPEPEQVIQDKNYKEMQYPAIQWIETKVDDMDLVHAMDTGLKILLNYSVFNNAEETIVPVTAPWGISGHVVNGTISQNYIVHLLLVPQVKSPPAPTDPTVKFGSVSDGWYFVRAVDRKLEEKQYEEHVLEFLKDLEEDNQPFEPGDFSLNFYCKWGLMEIAFLKASK
ncbi:heme-binding protein 2-like [Chiloscyllium punctatum]|uniref:heme-binding protein 2-like n=1 Tax=Chiloscyllium punctatum TaxID=137246 RepID=UPI003B634E32